MREGAAAQLLALGAVLLLMPGPVQAQQEPLIEPSCLSCEPPITSPALQPGSPAARRAIFGQLARPSPYEGLVDPTHPPSQDEPTMGCGQLALISGAVTGAIGVLLAVMIQGLVPWEDDSSTTELYLVAGGVGFATGAGYALIRCGIEGPPS